jgi:hypothetical protein
MKTREQPADILTKGVSNTVLHIALCKMGLWDIFVLAQGGMLKKKT